jgi:tRNA(fMet)-specific endonuclease VapC
MPVMELPSEAGQLRGAIRTNLEAKGEMIGNNDCGSQHTLRRWDFRSSRNNEREFQRVEGLKTQNWVA